MAASSPASLNNDLNYQGSFAVPISPEEYAAMNPAYTQAQEQAMNAASVAPSEVVATPASDTANSAASGETWWNYLVGGYTTNPNDPALQQSSISSQTITDKAKEAIAAALPSWVIWANEAMVRVIVAILALIVIFLALRKMV